MRSIVFIAVFVISMAIVMGAYCDQYTNSNDLRISEGKVTAVSVADSTLAVQIGIEIVFNISSDTELRYGSGDIKLSDIEVGDYVKIEYYRQGLESRTPAKVIRVSLIYKKPEGSDFSGAETEKDRRF